MDATSFELNVTVAADPRFAETLRELAVHAARYAGCRGADADLFGAAVETVVRASIAVGTRGGSVEGVVRRVNGPLEFLIATESAIPPVAANDPHISVGEITVNGRRMCCVARRMPADT